MEKFCTSTTGLKVVGGFATADLACTVASTPNAMRIPAKNLRVIAIPPGLRTWNRKPLPGPPDLEPEATPPILPVRRARDTVNRHVSGASRLCKCTFRGHTWPMEVPSQGEVLRRMVERADLELFTDRVLDSFWDEPAFEQLHARRDDVRAWVRWNLNLAIRWIAGGETPGEDEIAVFREHARARVAEGFPADMIAASFRRVARVGWRARVAAATAAARPALVEIADLLFEYVDRVSRIYSEVYESAAKKSAPTPEEIAARDLRRRIPADEAPLTEDQRLAERIGFRIERAARPFVIAVPGRSAQDHAELAARLRRRHALAAAEGRRVIGLSNLRAPWTAIALEGKAIIAGSPPAIGGERGHALDELRGAVELAAAHGRSGEIDAGDYLPELLLSRSPRLP